MYRHLSIWDDKINLEKRGAEEMFGLTFWGIKITSRYMATFKRKSASSAQDDEIDLSYS